MTEETKDLIYIIAAISAILGVSVFTFIKWGKNMFKKILFIFLLAALLVPGVVLADGMMVPPPDRYIYETDQKAVIFYEDGKEKLVLSTAFNGDVEDFAWIVPTPTRPQVNKASDELFISLQELTLPNYDYPEPTPFKVIGGGVDYAQEVYVHETKRIDYYDIAVLSAANGDALRNWLNNNGYDYPASGGYILDSYIANGWYFTAIKVVDDYLTEGINSQFRSGHAVPLMLDFQSDKIVYPLKISSIVHQNNLDSNRYYANRRIGILLYVITSNRRDLPQFATQYAGWIKKEKIENLAYDDKGNPWFSPSGGKYFLTKLYRPMMASEMTNDLYFRQAKDNTTVNAAEETESRGFTVFIVIMLVGGVVMIGLLALLLASGVRKE